MCHSLQAARAVRARFETKRKRFPRLFFRGVAGATGLEPATYGVTGRHSNQLSYAPAGDGQFSETSDVSGRSRGVKANPVTVVSQFGLTD
jgi:hypothetical protein